MFILGTIYAWSTFKNPLMAAHGWSGAEVGLTFTLTVVFQTLACAFGGRFVDKAGARSVVRLSAILFGAGTMLAGVADMSSSKWLLWLSYGVIAGIGNGLGYITPIAVLVRWFPDKRGLVTGLAIMSFGLGGALMGQASPLMIIHFGVASTFYIVGAVFLVVLLLAAQRIENPPAGYSISYLANANQPAHFPVSVNLPHALGMNQFYLLWVVLFLNAAAGIALISNLSPMAQRQVGLSTVTAGSLLLVGALFNGLGRICCAALSDRLGRKPAFMLIIILQIPALSFLSHVTSPWVFGALACSVLFCYGGGFAIMPSFATETFGPQFIGSIYGKILLASGAASVAGPMLMEMVNASSGSFAMAFGIAVGGLIIGFVLTTLYRKPNLSPIV